MRDILAFSQMAGVTSDQVQTLLGLSKCPDGRQDLLTSGRLLQIAGIFLSQEDKHW